MSGILYEGSPLAEFLEEVGSPEETIRYAPPAALRARATPQTPVRGSGRIETGKVAPHNTFDMLHGLFGPLPAELSFLVSSSVTEAPSQRPLNLFAERLKHLICSSLLVAGPGAALVHYSTPPRSLQQRSGSLAASLSAIVVTAIAALRTRPIWSLISVVAIIWSYWSAKKKRGESQLTELQQKLLDRVEVLLHYAQCFDTSVSRILSLVREVECVSRGWGLSSPLPPISRIEQSTFASVGGGADDEMQSVRAVDMRRVLQQSLRDARQMCKATCGILERFIKGGEDGQELKGLYAAYGVTPESVQLASLALSGKRPRSPHAYPASPGLSARSRDPMRSSVQSKRMSVMGGRPASPAAETLGSSINSILASPQPINASEVERWNPSRPSELERRNSSRASVGVRSNRSSLFASKSDRRFDVERYGSDLGPTHEDLSLATIDGAVELLHVARQRTLCHLLAFDHDVEPLELEGRLQTATDAVSELAERFRCGNEALVITAEREFGGDCLTLPPLPDYNVVPGAFPVLPESQIELVPAFTSLPSDPARLARDSRTPETMQSFAPPSPAGHREQQHLDAFTERSDAMSLALRSVTAKMHVAGEDLRTTMRSPEPTDMSKIITMHDSIRADLEILMREWDQSRVSLRQALGPLTPPPRPPRRRLPDPLAFEEETHEAEFESAMVDMDRRSSAMSSELFTPTDPLSPPLDLDETAIMDEDTTEQVFEAIGGPLERPKVSREERIRLAQEKRERPESSTPRPDINMVVELKDVLRELGSRRK